MHRKLSRLIVTPLVTVAAASLSVGVAHAVPWNSVDLFPPKDPVETPFCSIDYVDPNDRQTIEQLNPHENAVQMLAARK